jgi:hypothetical protein
MIVPEIAKTLGIPDMPVNSQGFHSAQTILFKAAHAIGERASERDVEQERSMKQCVEIFNAATGLGMSEEDGWLFMVCLKMARAKGGNKFNLDDYIDLCAYGALAGECADANDKFPL